MTVKTAIRGGIARMAPSNRSPGLRVLVYHSIDDPDPGDSMSMRVSRQRFLEQMTLLRDGRYAVVPLAAARESAHDDDRLRVAITFDDGYRSMESAAEILQQFGFSATFFLVPLFLDGVSSPRAYWETWGHLGWEQARGMIARGFEIGAHSATHPDLTTCLDGQLDEEVAGAKRRLEDRLGTEVTSFSYPFGRHNARVRDTVARAGYRIACTSRYGLNQLSGISHLVRRTEVAGTDTLKDFVWKLQGKYDWLGYWHAMGRTAW